MEDLKEHEKEAQRQVEQLYKTSRGLLQYIDLLQYMQTIPDL